MVRLLKTWAWLRKHWVTLVLALASLAASVALLVLYITGKRKEIALLKAQAAAAQAEADVAYLRALQRIDQEKLKENRDKQVALDASLQEIERKQTQLKKEIEVLSADEVVEEFTNRGF